MFERLADFWDIVLFGFVLLMLASLQLRHATSVEVALSLAAMVCAVGLLLLQKWALLGLYIVLTASYPIYFGQIWLQAIEAGSGASIASNLLKMVVATLLFVYIGRERIERRWS